MFEDAGYLLGRFGYTIGSGGICYSLMLSVFLANRGLESGSFL